MAQGNPMPGEQYLHFKNRRYQVIAVAYHSETMERFVVYQALYGDFRTYVRPYDMFVSEVDHEKYPDVKQKYRFQYLGVPSTGEWKDVEGCAESGVVRPAQSAAATDEAVCEEGRLNPWLDKVLDATSFEEKYKLVCDMQGDITDKLIDDIAVVMDLAIPEGNLRERYAQLKYCLRTRQKYESGRLR